MGTKTTLGQLRPVPVSPLRRCSHTRIPFTLIIIGIAILGWSGCKKYDVIPEQMEAQLATDLTYEMVRSAPNEYQGKLVAWGGEVLAGKRFQEGTRLEILQLPLTDDLRPTEERARSKGRFIAFDNEGTITDPEAVKPGTMVTIVGRVGPAPHGELQGVGHSYPRVDVLDMTVWERKIGEGWLRYGPFGNLLYDPWTWRRYKRHRID